MSDQQWHAPGWRGRARRTGPIVGINDTPSWLVALERAAPMGCLIIFAIVAVLVAYAWATDFSAGHL